MPEELEREDADPARLALISDIFRTLTKTVKTFNVYPRGNPIYQKFAADLSERFDTFFGSNDDLLLDVEQFSLLYKGSEVFYSEDKTDNIALALYVDGIREICFHKGLSLEEIVDFIEILRLAPKEENVEDDIVTLLWEKDFEHVSYFVPEEVDEMDISMERDILPEGGFGENVAAGGASHLGVTARPTADLQGEELTSDEVAAIKTEAEQMDRDYLLGSAVDLFLELMPSEREMSSYAAYLKSISWVADLKVKEKDYDGFLAVLEKLRHFSDSSVFPEQKAAVDDVIREMGSLENMRVMFRAESGADVLARYLSLLGSGSISEMIEILGELEDRRMRRFLCGVLAGFASADMKAFEGRLEDGRWFLVRNLVMILGMTKDVRAVKIIGKVAKHPEVRGRREVVRALKTIHSPEAKAVLMSFIEDSDPGVRIDALTALRRYGGADLFSALKKIIAGEDFRERSFNEKREMLDAFGDLGKGEAFPVLAALFRKKGLFEREENVALRACAAYGLGHVGTDEAVTLLEKEKDSKKDILREACRKALRAAGK